MFPLCFDFFVGMLCVTIEVWNGERQTSVHIPVGAELQSNQIVNDYSLMNLSGTQQSLMSKTGLQKGLAPIRFIY